MFSKQMFLEYVFALLLIALKHWNHYQVQIELQFFGVASVVPSRNIFRINLNSLGVIFFSIGIFFLIHKHIADINISIWRIGILKSFIASLYFFARP